ncbi:MAG: hypothetical protein ACR2RV_08075, partial [Verrucomicrobiales bacterium]
FNGTNANVTWNDAEISTDTAYTLLDGTWGSLEINVDRNFVSKDAIVDVTIYEEAGLMGVAQNVFTDFAVQALTMENFRVQIESRTGGEAMDLYLDNIELEVEIFDPSDSDGDELPDLWETAYGLDPDDNGLNPNNNGVPGDPDQGAEGDPDMDTLTNEEEFALGTNPSEEDTDMDGLNDNVEDGTGTYVGLMNTGTNPLIPDSDGDGLEDGVEDPMLDFVDVDQPGTDPNNPDTDSDGVDDLDEILLGRDPTMEDIPVPVPGLLADFDGSGVLYSEAAVRSAPVGGLVPGGPSGNYYQLLNNIGDAGNYIAFDSTADLSGWTTAAFQMDFLAANIAADGWGVNFLSTEAHGQSGFVRIDGDGVEESALISNSFGVGFKTFEVLEATVTWNGLPVEPSLAPYTLMDGTWGSLEINVERDPGSSDAQVDLNIYEETGLQGGVQNVFTDFDVPNLSLEDFRVQIAGRTGGASMDLAIDNVRLIMDGGGASEFRIVEIDKAVIAGEGGDPDTISVTITWQSREGRTYGIYAAPDLPDDIGNWEELDDSLPGVVGEDLTSFTESGLSIDTLRRFYQVRDTTGN